MLRVALRVVAKPISVVEHISLSTDVKFAVTIGVGVVKSVMSKWWLSKKIRKT